MTLLKSVLKLGSEIGVSIMVVFSELTLHLISSSMMTTHWHLWFIKWACHSCCQIKNYGLLTGGHLLLTKAFWVCHTCCQISNKELLTEAKFILLNSAHLLLFCHATDTTLTILYQLYYLGHGHLWVGGPVTFFVRL